MIIDAFKIPLFQSTLGLDADNISKYCLELKHKNKGRNLSNVGGWQSNDLTGVHMPLNELFKKIVENVQIFSEQLKIKSKLTIDNIWVNINDYKDFNLQHIHPNTLISGIYYIQTPEDCGDLELIHPCSNFDYDWRADNFTEYNEYNSLNYVIKPQSDLLVLFPGYLPHFVKPNLNRNQSRISISFNSTYE